jgi:hypothetical protein
MPAFKDRLTHEEILAIIAFIKRGWPIGLRASRATLDPGYAGIPPEASRRGMEVSTDLQGRVGAKRREERRSDPGPGPGFVAEGFGDPPEAERPDGIPLGSVFQLGTEGPPSPRQSGRSP